MRLDAREETFENAELIWHTIVLDKDTGKRINHVIAADDSIGQIVRYCVNNDGQIMVDGMGNLVIISEIRNIELVTKKG